MMKLSIPIFVIVLLSNCGQKDAIPRDLLTLEGSWVTVTVVPEKSDVYNVSMGASGPNAEYMGLAGAYIGVCVGMYFTLEKGMYAFNFKNPTWSEQGVYGFTLETYNQSSYEKISASDTENKGVKVSSIDLKRCNKMLKEKYLDI
ncbi:MAG TPA: hypothetical protein PK055_10855 [Gammaproteobacteria bacterium]|nr:hypothetical protein [Xanthomonadales bacterium]HPI96638.1 hypothetical protein [Gammaproteobacteria bacterium]HPQ88148.1 hypothetical protein [Gammaproteobacteria bacterium]